MNAPTIEYLTAKRPFDYCPGWSRKVRVAGVVYWVGVQGVRRVRIAYRGGETGWQWSGFVRHEDGRRVKEGPCGGSIGARGLLKAAGILADERSLTR